MNILISVILVENNLQVIRQARNISLQELSLMTGLGKSTLDVIENGYSDPRLSTVFCLCRVLKLRVEDIFPY